VKDFFRSSAAALVFGAFLLAGAHYMEQPAFADSKSYQKDLSRGNYQMVKKDYESAVASFTLVLRENPNVYEAYLNRAQGRCELKDYEGALSDYDQAVKINPNVVECYIKRADLHAKMGDYKLAVDDYSLALRLSPKNAGALLNRGAAYKNSGDYQKAIADYSSALKLEPGSFEAIKERADCRFKINDFEGAIEDYEYLLKKNKVSATALRFNLGEVFLAKGAKGSADDNFKQVITYYSKTLKGSRKNGNDYLQRGLAYAKLGEIDKAISDLQEASAWKADEGLTKYNLGRLKIIKGDSKGAIADLTEAIRFNPKYSPALMERASAYAAEGEYMSAQKDLDAALNGEKTAEGFFNRAMARLAIGDSSGAVSDIGEAKNFGAQYVTSKKSQLQQQISDKETKGERDIALSDLLEKVALIEIGENNGDVAEALEKRALAIKEKQLSKHDPKLAHSYMMLGRAYLKKKSPTKAEALFRTAMTRLKGSADGTQKFAIFNLEDCAKLLIQSAQQEEAGAILVDTRMARAVSGMNDRALTGDLSRKADRAIESYKRRKRAESQEEVAQQIQPEGAEAPSVRRVFPAQNPSQTATASAILGEKTTNNKPIRDKWALIVGISNFKDSSINLHYCAKDAKDFYDFLVTEKNFAPDHVQMLTDSTATRANILSLLGNKWLPRVAEPDDLVVIYFSSHGSPSSLDVGGVNYLVAHDTDINDLYVTGIAMQDLSRIIKERVHCDRVMVLLDACHSGVAAPSSKGLARSANVNVDTIVQGTGQLVLSSSSPDQRSWESKRYQGSVFTKHLIEGLRKNGKMTKLGDAFTYLNDEVQREVMRDRGVLQNPVMKSKWEGDDLVIGVPPARPSKGLGSIELPDLPRAVTTGSTDSSKQAKSTTVTTEEVRKRPKASSTRRAR